MVALFSQNLAMSDDCGLSELLADLKEIPSLKDMVAAQSQMIDALDLNANSLQVGIVSYKQWVDISMELPCSKMERWEYSLLGLTVSADYPKFYPCDFNYNLPLPNEHIPYLRLKNAAKALAV